MGEADADYHPKSSVRAWEAQRDASRGVVQFVARELCQEAEEDFLDVSREKT